MSLSVAHGNLVRSGGDFGGLPGGNLRAERVGGSDCQHGRQFGDGQQKFAEFLAACVAQVAVDRPKVDDDNGMALAAGDYDFGFAGAAVEDKAAADAAETAQDRSRWLGRGRVNHGNLA